MAQGSLTESRIQRPFGNIPNAFASQLLKQLLGPLAGGLGFGEGKQQGKFESRLQNATGPLADFIRQVRGFGPDVIGQAQQAGNQVAQGSQQTYDQMMGQINNSLGASNQALDFARQSAVDAYSPIRQSAMFQNTANNVLTPLRQSQAARGFESQGGAQQQEQNVLQNLGSNFAQNQLGNQQNAISGLQQAAQTPLGISSQGFNAAQGLNYGLSQRYANPLQAAGGLFSLLTGGLSPGIQYTGVTAPQLGNQSTSAKGLGVLGGAGRNNLLK